MTTEEGWERFTRLWNAADAKDWYFIQRPTDTTYMLVAQAEREVFHSANNERDGYGFSLDDVEPLVAGL